MCIPGKPWLTHNPAERKTLHVVFPHLIIFSYLPTLGSALHDLSTLIPTCLYTLTSAGVSDNKSDLSNKLSGLYSVAVDPKSPIHQTLHIFRSLSFFLWTQ